MLQTPIPSTKDLYSGTDKNTTTITGEGEGGAEDHAEEVTETRETWEEARDEGATSQAYKNTNTVFDVHLLNGLSVAATAARFNVRLCAAASIDPSLSNKRNTINPVIDQSQLGQR